MDNLGEADRSEPAAPRQEASLQVQSTGDAPTGLTRSQIWTDMNADDDLDGIHVVPVQVLLGSRP